MRWEGGPKSSNVEDRRGQSFGGPLLIGGGGLGAIVVVIIALLLGANPEDVLNQVGAGQPTEQTEPGQPRADDKQAEFASVVLGSTEKVWEAEFQQRGRRYAPPTLVLYDNYTTTGCGGGQRRDGAVLLPARPEALSRPRLLPRAGRNVRRARRFRPGLCHRPRGRPPRPDPARRFRPGAPGAAGRGRARRQPDPGRDGAAGRLPGRSVGGALRLERGHSSMPGDIDEAVQAASSVGDDTLQKRSRGMVVPDAFTHGSSAQRVEWFKRGYEGGRMEACDTFGS